MNSSRVDAEYGVSRQVAVFVGDVEHAVIHDGTFPMDAANLGIAPKNGAGEGIETLDHAAPGIEEHPGGHNG